MPARKPTTATGRTKRMELLLGLGKKSPLNAKSSAARIMAAQAKEKYTGQAEIMMKINEQRNAIKNLSALKEGMLTGEKETPASIARKLEEKDPKLKLYGKIIENSLKNLGFGEILERAGLEAALIAFFAEMETAKKQAKKMI